MTEDIQRWAPYAVDGGCDAYGAMEEDHHGDYVNYEDHCAEIAALLARLEAVTQERDEAAMLLKLHMQRAEKAEAALAAAYREGLEAGAKVAETTKAVCARCNSPEDNHPYRHLFIPMVTVNIPSAIRALPDKTPAEIRAQIEERGE